LTIKKSISAANDLCPQTFNFVTEELLPLADYWGNKKGNEGDKMSVTAEVEKGSVLDVPPILTKSPWVYEAGGYLKSFLQMPG